jgi:hypothetical protein
MDRIAWIATVLAAASRMGQDALPDPVVPPGIAVLPRAVVALSVNGQSLRRVGVPEPVAGAGVLLLLPGL